MVKVVAFDFDGTLANSFDLVNKCIVEVLKEFNVNISEEEFYKVYGPTERGIFINLTDENKGKLMFDRYMELYKKYHDEYLNKLHDGVIEVLNYLKERGVTVVLLTGRSYESTVVSLDKFNLNNTFKKIYTGSDKGVNKPDNFKQLFKDFNVTNEECIYIGDSLKDIKSCKEVGVKILSISINDGESRLDQLKENNPLTFTNYKDLLVELKKCL